VSLMARVND